MNEVSVFMNEYVVNDSLQECCVKFLGNQFVSLEHPHPIRSFHKWSSATLNGPKNPTGVNLGHTNFFGPK